MADKNITLLFGRSGSGKTSKYIEAVKNALSHGRGAIILVPELTFSSRLIEEVKKEFEENLAVIHSSMPEKKLIEQWKDILSGKLKMVIGTRTALFAPVKDLGVIILDEEEGYAYKQEQNPKYHSREAAVFLSKQKNIHLIIGSGCPTIETYHKATIGQYDLKELPVVSNKEFPDIEIVDMKKENKQRFGILSKIMVEGIRETLKNGGKAVLFMNRRGFAPFLVCEDCGKPVICPNCSISLSYHASDKSLHCIKCGFSKTVPVACPNCFSSNVRFVGTGTQKVEREIARYFPKEKILRLDRDIAGVKNKQDIVIKMFAEGEANILIGTQMAVRALEAAKVSFAGIVSADMALDTPDFRAGESIFEMISEISGASKRIEPPKQIVVQTYNPEHYVFNFAKKLDYRGFYEKEIVYRKESGYPPFGQLINIIIFGKTPTSGQSAAEDIAEKIVSLDKEIEVLGPVQTSLAKVRGRSRWQILIKGQDLDIIKDELRGIINDPRYRKELKISVDVDPISIT